MSNIYDDDNPSAIEQFDEATEQGDDPGYNFAQTSIDGHTLGWEAIPGGLDEIERVQVSFPLAENGEQTDADERAPLGWCNSAAISLDRDDDAVHLSISVGDPRGAFVLTVRRLSTGELVMHFPTPEGTSHMPLTLDHSGTYLIGH